MFLWHESFWHGCLLTLACVLKCGSAGTQRIQICRSGRIKCQDLKNIWVTLLQTAVVRVCTGQRWINKTVHSTANPSSWRYEALLEILGKLQKANAQERMICFARFCQTRLNCEFILHTLMCLLDHKYLSNLRIFKFRLGGFSYLWTCIVFTWSNRASGRLFLQITDEQNPLHHRWRHPQMTPSWGNLHLDLAPQTRWDA